MLALTCWGMHHQELYSCTVLKKKEEGDVGTPFF